MDGIFKIFTERKLLYSRFTMKLSACMAIYNDEQYILDVLSAIQNQTFTDFECILVDDHSTDNTVELITKFIANDTRFKLFVNMTDKSRPYVDSHNMSYLLASGELLLRLDQDDIPKPDMFEKIVAYLDEHPEVDVVCTAVQHVEEDCGEDMNEAIKKDVRYSVLEEDIVRLYNTNSFIIGLFKDHALWMNQTACLRRDFYVKHNPRFEELKSGDVLFWLTIFAHGATPAFIPEKLLHYRIHVNSTCRQKRYWTSPDPLGSLIKLSQAKAAVAKVWYERTHDERYKAAYNVYKFLNSRDPILP